jgi:hypothetical protein
VPAVSAAADRHDRRGQAAGEQGAATTSSQHTCLRAFTKSEHTKHPPPDTLCVSLQVAAKVNLSETAFIEPVGFS